ncbi:uncharacterized protein LOC127845139 [Dreissena polymorpha]|nr:uncharacterized protein LOC127845139 [Dreissena polymorpha]
MLLTNVVYNVTMKWGAGSHSGSDSIDIRRDTNLDAMLNIYGVPSSGTVDVNEKLGLKAEFKTCLTVVDIEYLWELSPIYNIPQARQTRSTYIPAGSLAYGTAYNLTCTVTYAGKEISATVRFTTEAEPIDPAFVISGTPLSLSLAEMRFTDDLKVACVNGKKPTDISGLLCTWTCENNVFSPTTFSPCFELVDDKVQPLKREGQSVVISGASRIDPQKWDLRERWTLTMRQLSSKEMTVTKEFLFKKVPLELKAPHLTTKINKLSVTRTDTSLDIKARCRQLTSYHWNPPSVNGDIGLPILNFTMVVRGDVKKEVEYTGDTFIPCGVEIDLTSTELVANTTYSLVIEVYNSRDDIRLSAREEFEIFVIPEPIAGSISLSYAGSKLTALTTPITIALVNWWDAVDDRGLECWYYFFEDGTSGDKVTNINTLSNPLTQGISNITLPEGKHKIGAKCCNRFGMCVKQVYDTALTVAPIDASGLLSAVQDVLEQVRKGGTDSILNTILGLLKATKEVGLTGEQAAETQTTIGDTSNMVIGDLLDSTDGDVESSLNVLESTSEIVKANPSGISEETKATIMSASTEVSKERIGIEDGNQQRRKRSTGCRTYSNPAGLQESEAITLLKAFDATINEVSITSIQASLYLETIENIMIGFCQAFSGSSAWVAPAEKVYVREHTMALGDKGGMQLPVSCDSCESVTHPTHPALVSYGAHLGAYFNDTWACTSDTTCDDVCVASAQLKVDTVTPTAATEVIAPPRRSDLVVLKMINPETYCEQAFPALTDPLKVELTLTGTIDTEKYYYQCLMWVNENWSGSKCTSSGVVLDQSSSRNTTTCSCTTLGIIGVFEVSKDATTTTVATTTVATTTAAPSKTLMANTDAVEYTFTLNVDYDTHVINVATFKTSMKTQIASKTGVPEACITNLELAKGSIIISFDLVVNAGSGTLGQLAYAVESVFTSGGSVIFKSPSGLTLTVESGSFKIVQKNMDTGSGQDNKKETSDKNNLPMIIGASLGGLAIVGVVVVLVVYIVKFKVTKRTHPITPVSAAKFPDEPPPAYGPTPPPPFMYEPPPHAHMTNKWVENELQQTHKANGRPVTPVTRAEVPLRRSDFFRNPGTPIG